MATNLETNYTYSMAATRGKVTSRAQRAAKQEEYAKMTKALLDQYEKGGTNVTAGTYTSAGTLKALKSASGVSGANELISKLLEAQKADSKTLTRSSIMSNFFKTSQGRCA
jgi:hypothetical protein